MEREVKEVQNYLNFSGGLPRKGKSNIYSTLGSQDHSNDDSEGLDGVD